MPEQKAEFTVQNAYRYDLRNTGRWLLSHVWRHKQFLSVWLVCNVMAYMFYSSSPILFGKALEEISDPSRPGTLVQIALLVLLVLVLDGVSNLIGWLSIETTAQRLERDVREELYASLLGKSQTFHDRQRVGDIMARATDDVRQLNAMMNPGVTFIYETFNGFTIPILFIASVNLQLLLVPLLFAACYILLVRSYIGKLEPVVRRQRDQFGKMNAGLEESISGIEVVKASAQEIFERKKFRQNARLFRDFFVRQGRIEAGYLPLLFYGFAVGGTFLHAMSLYQQSVIALPQVVTVMGLMAVLRWPTFASIFSFSLLQQGLASATRILTVIKGETDLDQNKGGYAAPIRGEISFDNVSFYFENAMVLESVSFKIEPGKTVAIVGQTGSGKSTLTQLVNRTYDATYGRVLIDGVDVTEWDLDSLRSQISKIEQDVFLFSRTIAENIAFGMPNATQEQIEQAAKEAQAHDFISSFADGYKTVIGERGVTLSGGQRQRLALARAFLSNPAILILDDSTSAIDSATEDEIQKAIRRAQEGRTTLLITHRLSQIRWADHIIVLEKGHVVASGKHEELLRKSKHYRRIFARYDVELPPLEGQSEAASPALSASASASV
ncbi:MAG: ABC transporter ATP-binding protein [Anaerolineae bacterium]|nr:ABC transporter ATP-binding protein [Anaerolineae bacterium]